MFFATCESMVHTINFVKYMYALIINYTHRNVFVCVCVCLDLKLLIYIDYSPLNFFLVLSLTIRLYCI